MIAPGYYQAECSEKKPCKEGMYCNVLYCEKCHKLNVGCNSKDQCCKGLVCTFGRCEKKAEGDPGEAIKYFERSLHPFLVFLIILQAHDNLCFLQLVVTSIVVLVLAMTII